MVHKFVAINERGLVFDSHIRSRLGRHAWMNLTNFQGVERGIYGRDSLFEEYHLEVKLVR